MNCKKVGELIRHLRIKKNMTQRQLAQKINISDKTVSKWERGMGCPDVSLLTDLSSVLDINIEDILKGNMPNREKEVVNMKNAIYFVCPVCGNISMGSGNMSVSCCGAKLKPLEAKKAGENERLKVEDVENEWFVTSDHPMRKDCYISFAAFATGDKIQLFKLYPEWDMQVRIPRRGHGKLLWYSTEKGLFYQLL